MATEDKKRQERKPNANGHNKDHGPSKARVDQPNRRWRGDKENSQQQQEETKVGKPNTRSAHHAKPKEEAAAPAVSRPVVHQRKDMHAAATWSKGSTGPSFADMVRQRLRNNAEPAAASTTTPAAATPAATTTPPPEVAAPEKPPQVIAERPPKEEVVMAAPAAVAETPRVEQVVPEPPRSTITSFDPMPQRTPYHVLEVERVSSVKLPLSLMKYSNMQYDCTFSSQAGKAPTPPVQVTQPVAAVYRPETANLANRQWSAAPNPETRIPMHPGQWNAAAVSSQGLDALYWPAQPAERAQPGRYHQLQYNSYAPPAAQQHRPGQAYFSARPRNPEFKQDSFSQVAPGTAFSRPPVNGGVW